jgi:hypothetical protein
MTRLFAGIARRHSPSGAVFFVQTDGSICAPAEKCYLTAVE